MPDRNQWKAEDYAEHGGFLSRLSHDVMTDLAPRQQRRLRGRRGIEGDPVQRCIRCGLLQWGAPWDAPPGRAGRALKPGGRFVAEMGGEGNSGQLRKVMTAALAEIGIDFVPRDPWTFPSPQEQRARLEGAGSELSAAPSPRCFPPISAAGLRLRRRDPGRP